MKFFIYVAGMPFDGESIKTKSLGGSETMGYNIAKGLTAEGHNVFVFCNTPDGQAKNIDGIQYIPIGQVTEQSPLGENFMRFADKVPHDVMLGQRHPMMFNMKYNSKVNLWWTHDLALKRSERPVNNQMWNVDRVLAVSDFHKDQIYDVYGIPKDSIGILRNCVDFDEVKEIDPKNKIMGKTMLYSSRPERGLEQLVCPGGIMEKLYQKDQNIRLIVTSYDHVSPEMQPFYQMLWDRCNKLPNVELYPPCNKETLYNIMSGAWLHIYPTDFEETSCITAMEEQCHGTPFLASKVGALPETLEGGGAYFIDDPNPTQAFIDAILLIRDNEEIWYELHEKAIEKSREYSITRSTTQLLEQIYDIFEKNTSNPVSLVKHFIRNSDIIAAKKVIEQNKDNKDLSQFAQFISREFDYVFSDNFKKVYDEVADYHINVTKNDHRLGMDQYHLNMPRVQTVLQLFSRLPKGSRVLDYGCCVGQQTIAYARAFPELSFIGCDISQKQISIAKKFTSENKIKNVFFQNVDNPSEVQGEDFDMVVCLEVLEHVLDTQKFLSQLESKAKIGGIVCLSTPSGAYEFNRVKIQEQREHIHHFEEEDILEIASHKKFMDIVFTYGENDKYGDVLGNYTFYWEKTEDDTFGQIDYDRKLKIQSPKQLVSVCMICRKDSETLGSTLKSLAPIYDEVIIGFDCSTQGNAESVAHRYGAKTLSIPSPREIGFDNARNLTIEQAKGDWIIWIDDDETFQWSERASKYLRNNPFTAYAVAQHHFSCDPAGILKTDLPARIFRNRVGIRFFGFVHEHPEIEMNKGIGHVFMLPDKQGCVSHHGYDTEETRRNRFQRNFPLMVRDRELYPDRILGRFLWVRDLAHMNRFELEKTGGYSQDSYKRAEEAVREWRILVEQGHIRMVIDSMQYLSECVKLLTNGSGVEFSIGIALRKNMVGDKEHTEIKGMVYDRNDLDMLIKMFIDDKTKDFDLKYI